MNRNKSPAAVVDAAMLRREPWAKQLVTLVAVTVLSFTIGTIFTQWQLVTVGRASSAIADNYAPSIEHLAAARGELRHLQVVLRDFADGQATSDAVENARHAMDDAITSYLQLPNDAQEQALWRDILSTKDSLNLTVERCLTRPEPRACNVTSNADALSSAITRAVELNASRSHDGAVLIEQTYARARVFAVIMALLCVAIAVLGATALRRAFRAHTELARQHRDVLEARASELEEFAGRVAHDILSPLNVVNLALSNAVASSDASTREQMGARAKSAIKRVDHLVSGLLDFAVAAARPQQGASSNLADVVEELRPELEEAAKRANAELCIDDRIVSSIACNPGVLASVVSNLAHNALKYVAKSETRRVELHATEKNDRARIEVSDTGPGLPAGLEARVFDPYVRGKNATLSGIGLGLATVKRIATAHGGDVGVVSRPGLGCTFWVELPKSSRVQPA